MITDQVMWDYERAHLERVVKEIKTQLDNGINAARDYKKDAIELQKQMWEDVRLTPTSLFDLEDATQIWQYQASLSNQARKYKFAYGAVERLERMQQNPYFGRIDFVEEGEEKPEKIYIGIHNLSAGKTREIIIYDWRAPISGMFYDFETGTCSYDCPAGTINGEMLLKRQYKIENQSIVYMFDSSLSINDDMLKEILGKSTDSRMKTIVTSIQREQNTVIRNSQDRILIVEGPAGSGKTSIALHRAAYLLYKYRETIKSENILVFSPNNVFEDYISNVLPELGEENIQRNTFAGFFANMLEPGCRIETMDRQMEYILSANPDKTRLRSIEFKASVQFLDIMKKYIGQLEDGVGLKFKDLVFNDTPVVSAEEILSLFREDYSRFPFAKRLEKLQQRLFYLLEQCEALSDIKEEISDNQKTRQKFESLKNDILQMTAFNINQLYRDLFNNLESYVQTVNEQEFENLRSIGSHTVCQLEKGIINYEDLAPVIFLKAALDSVSQAKTIKHVIVDEAQDYTVIHYEILKMAFGHCNMTILGDVNQSVNGFMNVGSFNNISDIFDRTETKSISLTKSYRSSKEIADFCTEILKVPNRSEQLNRHGNKPRIIKVNKSNLFKRIADDVNELKSMGHKLIAVICKTAGQCEALHKAVRTYLDVSLISNQNEEYSGGVVIIPSYIAKGLEFDAVLVYSIEDGEYSREEDRRLLYTVCTRALHELYMYYHDNMSGFVKNIDENLRISIQEKR